MYIMNDKLGILLIMLAVILLLTDYVVKCSFAFLKIRLSPRTIIRRKIEEI